MTKQRLFSAALFLLFVCPGQAAYSQGEPERRIYPVRYNGHIHLTGTINDSLEGCFVFDTGADRLYLDSLYLASSGLKYDRAGRTQFGGVGTVRRSYKTISDPLLFRFDSRQASFSNTPILHMKPLLGRYCDGIVGWDYFRGRIVEFNYAGEYIRILEPDESKQLAGYKEVPVIVRNNRFFVPGKLEMPSGRKIRGEFLLDIGSSGTVALTSVAAQKYNLTAIDPSVPYFTDSGGLGGRSSGAFVRGGSFTIGGFTIDRPLVRYSNDKAGSLASTRYLGLLGNEILDHFDVVIDFQSMRLYLKPNEKYGKQKDRALPRFGFGCVDRTDISDGYIVSHLLRDRNAHRAGLQLGDLITHIDEAPLKTLRIEQVYGVLAAPDRVTLTVVRGEETLRIELPLVDQGI